MLSCFLTSSHILILCVSLIPRPVIFTSDYVTFTFYSTGMLLKENDLQSSSPAHLPCWKCYGQMACTREIPTDVKLENTWVYHNARPVYCFGLTESIVPAALGHDLECPLHGKIEIVHTAPDLVRCIVKWLRNNSVSPKEGGKGTLSPLTFLPPPTPPPPLTSPPFTSQLQNRLHKQMA